MVSVNNYTQPGETQVCKYVLLVTAFLCESLVIFFILLLKKRKNNNCYTYKSFLSDFNNENSTFSLLEIVPIFVTLYYKKNTNNMCLPLMYIKPFSFHLER